MGVMRIVQLRTVAFSRLSKVCAPLQNRLAIEVLASNKANVEPYFLIAVEVRILGFAPTITKRGSQRLTVSLMRNLAAGKSHRLS